MEKFDCYVNEQSMKPNYIILVWVEKLKAYQITTMELSEFIQIVK